MATAVARVFEDDQVIETLIYSIPKLSGVCIEWVTEYRGRTKISIFENWLALHHSLATASRMARTLLTAYTRRKKRPLKR